MYRDLYPKTRPCCRTLHRGLATACFALVLLGAGPATAQFAVNEIQLYDPDPDPDAKLSDYQITNEFFSKANCECRKSVRIRLRINIDRQNTNKFFVVAGSGTCIDTNQNAISANCLPVLKEGRIDQQAQDIEITTGSDGVTVYDLMQGNCSADQQLSIYVFTGQENAITPAGTLAFTADGTAPTAPVKDGDPSPGEELVSLKFQAGSSTETGVRYQILCEEANTGQPGFANPTGAGYSYCANPQSSSDGGVGLDGGGEVDSGVPDHGVPDQGAPDFGVADGPTDSSPVDASADSSTVQDSGSSGGSITSLDPRFVCSSTLTSAGSAEIGGLNNGVKYRFYVVAFDLHGNASSPVLLGEATPLLAEDLWERYKRAGGPATGGYCNVANTSAPPWLLLGLLALGLLWRRGGAR